MDRISCSTSTDLIPSNNLLLDGKHIENDAINNFHDNMLYKNSVYQKKHTNLRTLTGLYGINLFELKKFIPYIGESESKINRLKNPNNSYIKRSDFQSQKCELCDKTFSDFEYIEHVNSDRHQLNLKKLDSLRMINLKLFLRKHSDSFPQLKCIQISELSKFVDYIGESENKIFRLNNPNDNYIDDTNEAHFCRLCNKKCINIFNLHTHLQSDKHQLNLQKLISLRHLDLKKYLRQYYKYVGNEEFNVYNQYLLNSNDCFLINKNFLCPISQNIMIEPVIASDGYTYDKISLEKLFETSNVSPVTNVELNKEFIPNLLVLNLIKESLSLS